MDDIRFDFGLSFVRPDSIDEFARLKTLLERHPGSRLSLFGHADPVGDDEGNKILSGRRAVAVYAVLTRRTDLWETLYSERSRGDRWGQRQLDTMSAALNQARSRYDSADQRLALFARYMDLVCRTVDGMAYTLDPVSHFLGQHRDENGRGDYHGCGEFNPVLMFSAAEAAVFAGDPDKTARNAANAPNRRVVGLIFDRSVDIDLARWPCPAALDGPARCHERLFADQRIRRRFQSERRMATAQGDTFACRFFDRISTGSPCNAATPLPTHLREAIPLVFVPGIMGSRLRLGADHVGDPEQQSLPRRRWDPSDAGWMLANFFGRGGARRKAMLVGPQFRADFLEVDNADPIGNGFRGIFSDYHVFLHVLERADFDGLNRFFAFPVYAIGYNWTNNVDSLGDQVATRIKAIIAEARKTYGACEKVILITHSMGGLVARSASELHGARDSILGIVHGVQPATGAPSGYWRMKAGIEGKFLGFIPATAPLAIGCSAKQVTPVLANIPGGMQLLPNKHHLTNNGAKEWLTVTSEGRTLRGLPTSDPYSEIYRLKAVVRPGPGDGPSFNEFWGLVDPDLLDPGNVTGEDGDDLDRLRASADRHSNDPWREYGHRVDEAEAFHNALGQAAHPRTLCLAGTGQPTVDVVQLRVESNWVRSDPYPVQGFRGFFRDDQGNELQAILQDPDPAHDGDGTVNVSSARAVNTVGRPGGDAIEVALTSSVGDRDVSVQHQPAYESAEVQEWAVAAITALCKVRYYEQYGEPVTE